MVTSTPLDGVAEAGSMGRPLPGIELRLVDRAGQPLAAPGTAVAEHADPPDVPADVPADDVVRAEEPAELAAAAGSGSNGSGRPEPSAESSAESSEPSVEAPQSGTGITDVRATASRVATDVRAAAERGVAEFRAVAERGVAEFRVAAERAATEVRGRGACRRPGRRHDRRCAGRRGPGGSRGRHRPGRAPRPESVLRLLARDAPAVRTPTAGSSRPTWGSSTAPARCTWSTVRRTSWSSAASPSTRTRWSGCWRAAGRRRGGGHRGAGRAHGPGGPRGRGARSGCRELDADAVRAHCRGRLARFKVPAQVVFVDELPRTPAGRLARHRLADRTAGT